VRVTTALISRPYVDITTNLMRRFGVDVDAPDAQTFVVPDGARYVSPEHVRVEGDASSASYFLAAGVIGAGPVRVTGVGRESIQGDVGFADVLARLGARISFGPDWIEAARGPEPLAGGTLDCTAIPDAAMTLAVTGLFARDAHHADRHRELAGEGDRSHRGNGHRARQARRNGECRVPTGCGSRRWSRSRQPTIDTYDDHRVAMCFSLAAFGGRAGDDQRSVVRAQDISRVLRRVARVAR
jgi:3-phosphoshikimate 1-carboxyvinyltransferase